MAEDWLGRWQKGNIGWHQESGNKHLRKWWDVSTDAKRVLVPLCGKTIDLLWLAKRGHAVTGVELSPVAAKAFFEENALKYVQETVGAFERYRAHDVDIEIVSGDYFSFAEEPFDAMFDRGALVAVPPELRPDYAAHTRRLLAPGAFQLLITLAYEQARVAGPPFSVPSAEVRRYWPTLRVVDEFNALEDSPPKFRNAGLASVDEAIWSGRV
ncbi:MAG: methyltransferase domain-containing protein [Chromatiales bacterium]|jgi:thiopurine S-methyltransferase|nr:methyltransferase domain-containing protein [Chromatiales bacterium]